MNTLHTVNRRKGLAASLLALLLVGSFAAHLPVAASALDGSRLAAHRGAGFWSDPCTQDGFAVGAGATLCFGASAAGGCITAFVGLLRAMYVDDCF